MKESSFENKDKRPLEEVFMEEYFSHEPSENYSTLAMSANFVENKDPYVENLLDLLVGSDNTLTELGELIAEKIRSGVVVDLGCDSGLFQDYVRLAGVNIYIGVDKSIHRSIILDITAEEADKYLLDFDGYDSDDSQSAISGSDFSETFVSDSEATPQMEIKFCNENTILVEGDMLITLARLPDKSVAAIIASGIEEYKRDKTKNSGDYSEALKQEIKRVLIDGGIFLGYYTDITPSLSDKFNRIGPPKKDWSFNILEKTP